MRSRGGKRGAVRAPRQKAQQGQRPKASSSRVCQESMSSWEAQRGDGGPGGQGWTTKGLEHVAEGLGLCPQGAGSGGMSGGALVSPGGRKPPTRRLGGDGLEGRDWGNRRRQR